MVNVYYNYTLREAKLSGTFINRCILQDCTLVHESFLPKGSRIMYYENYNECCDGNGYAVVDVGGSYVEESSDLFILLTPRNAVYFIAKRHRY